MKRSIRVDLKFKKRLSKSGTAFSMFILWNLSLFHFKSLARLFLPTGCIQRIMESNAPKYRNRFWFICRSIACWRPIYIISSVRHASILCCVFKLNFIAVVKLLNQFNPYSFIQHKSSVPPASGALRTVTEGENTITGLQVLLLLMRISESCYRNQQCYIPAKNASLRKLLR